MAIRAPTSAPPPPKFGRRGGVYWGQQGGGERGEPWVWHTLGAASLPEPARWSMRFKRSFQDTLLELAKVRQAAEAAAAAAAQDQPGQASWSPRQQGWQIFQAIFRPSEGGDGKVAGATTAASDLDTDGDEDEEHDRVEDPETLRILLRSLLTERHEDLADFFSLIDTDGDGKVTVDELAVALQGLGLNATGSALAELCDLNAARCEDVDAPPAGTPSPRGRLPSSSVGFPDLQRVVWQRSPGQRASKSSRSPTEQPAGARWGMPRAEVDAMDLSAPHESVLAGPPSTPREAASETRAARSTSAPEKEAAASEPRAARSSSLPEKAAAARVEPRAKGMSSSLWGAARGDAAKSESHATVFETLQEAAKHQEVIARNHRRGSAIVVGAALEQGKSIADTERTDTKIQRRLASAKRAGAGPELPSDAFDFEGQRAGRQQPYYMRGDARYDTPAGLKKRLQLLESGKVARAARQFWDALQLRGDDAAMSYDDYCKVHPNLNPNLNPNPNPDPNPYPNRNPNITRSELYKNLRDAQP